MILQYDEFQRSLEQLRDSSSPVLFSPNSAVGLSDHTARVETSTRQRRSQTESYQHEHIEIDTLQDHKRDQTIKYPAVHFTDAPTSSSIHCTDANPFDTDFGAAEGSLSYHTTWNVGVELRCVYYRSPATPCQKLRIDTINLDDIRRKNIKIGNQYAYDSHLVWETLHHAEVTDSIFRNCWVQCCIVTSLTIGKLSCRFTRCDVHNSILQNCEVWGGTLDNCNVSQSLLVGVTITRGKLESCLLDRCRLEEAVNIGIGVGVQNCTHFVRGKEMPFTIRTDGDSK